MKKLLSYIVLPLLIGACNDQLIERPKSIAEETFYNTPGEAEAAVAAIYTPLRSGAIYGAEYIAFMECYTDYYQGRASWAPNSDFQGLDGTNNTRTATKWEQFYLSIRNANLVIANVPSGTGMSDAEKSQFVGEARYLRALAYFQLAKCWGGVVIRTEENMNEPNVPRSSKDEVYNLIKSDLQFAESNLPDDAPVAGRATRWAAKTLLADVYFFLGENEAAGTKAEEVITSGKYALIEVADASDFDKLYGPDVVSSPEEIFYLKFSQEQQWAYPLYTHGVGTPYIVSAGYMALYSTEDNPIYASWDNNDLRKSYGWYKWEFGLGDNTILNKKFSDPGNPQRRNDYPLYRYADVLLLYAEASCEMAGGPTPEGLEALNQVHRRAYGYPSATASPVDFRQTDYNKEQFVELVRKERMYETQAEGKRWHDLVRTGKAAEYIKAATGKDIAEKHYLWPIPVSEMNYNEALDPAVDQNPGY